MKERETIDLIAQGLTNREIADRLNLSTRAIENRRRPALAKMGCDNGTKVAVAVQRMRFARMRDWSKTSPD